MRAHKYFLHEALYIFILEVGKSVESLNPIIVKLMAALI